MKSGPTKVHTVDITEAFPGMEMLGEHPSYHQSITGKEAIRRLKESGHPCCYLTRYSEAQKSYILTVYQQQSPQDMERHFRIIIDKNGRQKIDGEKREFKNIGKLLSYYETHRIHPSLRNIGCGYNEDELNKKPTEDTRPHRKCIIL